MALHQLVLFFLFPHCGLSESMRISAVFVQEGQSTIMPCLYEKEHEDDTKLWCRRDNLSKCAAAVNSNQSQSAAGVSISDDITHGIFTVNMTNIRHEYADGSMLSVLNPMISGYESGTASVFFQHRFPGKKRQFCQLGGECGTLTLHL
ncbi:CMRF35-like molecule 3 isoform X2 [Alosa sapidissima]|uniref:CMRF35-like molecule 3 isoform X2 n=1 Tax=Alosa sapidissima TaxID=34773 RepID=UPI001C0A2A4D|nr:CMRF35-like molecule 3 isoform X2 [Alosa sapidissima]